LINQISVADAVKLIASIISQQWRGIVAAAIMGGDDSSLEEHTEKRKTCFSF
jgi:hypothetical protein